jgi:hypothetical protein
VIALEAVRGCWGVCELVAPNRVVGGLVRHPADGRTRVVARILGARHVAQAVLTLRGDPVTHALGGAVDLTHSASMVLLALVDRRRRRAAVTSAAIALGFGIAEIAGAVLAVRKSANSVELQQG